MKRKVVLIVALIALIPAALIFHRWERSPEPRARVFGPGYTVPEEPTPSVAEIMSAIHQALNPPGTGPVNDWDPCREIDPAVDRMVLRHEFDKLEEVARRLREENVRTLDGSPLISTFYSALSRSHLPDWKPLLEALKEWTRVRPESITARVALAEALQHYAWDARGGGWAHTVAPSAWDLFTDRLQQSEAQLRLAEGISTNEAHLYSVRLWVAIGLGWERDRMEQAFARAVAIDPSHYPAYCGKAVYLLPRWHGSPGEHVGFITNAPADPLAAGEDTTFWRLVTSSMNYGSRNFNNSDSRVFLDEPALQERLFTSFAAARRRFPRSSFIRFRNAQLALKAGRRSEAREALRGLDVNAVNGMAANIHTAAPWIEWANTESPIDPVTARFILPGRAGSRAVSLSPDGRLVAAGIQGQVLVWERRGADYQLVQQFNCSHREIMAVQFSPDGKQLAAGSGTGGYASAKERFDLFVWNTGDWHRPVTLRSVGSVCALLFSPDSKTLITGGGLINKFEHIEHINLETLERAALPRRGLNCVFNLLWYPDHQGYVGSDGPEIFHKRGDLLEPRPDTIAPQAIGGMAMTSDGRHLASGRYISGEMAVQRGELELWALDTWEPLSRFEGAKLGGVRTMVFSPDDRLLLVGSDDALISIWNVETGQRVGNLVGHTSTVGKLALSQDGKILASASFDGTVILWDWRKALPTAETPR